MSNTDANVQNILKQLSGMIGSLEKEHGMKLAPDGTITNTRQPTNMASGKTIRWSGTCPEGLVGFNVETAAAKGIAPPPFSERPHPEQYDKDGHLCVSRESAKRAVEKSTENGTVTLSRTLVASCAKLAHQLGTIGRAQTPCVEVDRLFTNNDQRTAFCENLQDGKGDTRCAMLNGSCANKPGVTARGARA